MNCPGCNKDMICDCRSCAPANAGKVTWITEGDFVSCGHCGLKKHHVDWMDIEWEQMKAKEKENEPENS